MVLPPESWLDFTPAGVAQVPAVPGVFQLLDGDKNVLLIKGAEDLRAALTAQLSANPEARHFTVEEAPLYTQRESQLIQAYVQQHGQMPGGGASELDELFD
jgi:hypothetical protein